MCSQYLDIRILFLCLLFIELFKFIWNLFSSLLIEAFVVVLDVSSCFKTGSFWFGLIGRVFTSYSYSSCFFDYADVHHTIFFDKGRLLIAFGRTSSGLIVKMIEIGVDDLCLIAEYKRGLIACCKGIEFDLIFCLCD